MVKKLMRLHVRSISGALRAVLDSKLRLYPRCSGWMQERAGHCPCPDDSARDEMRHILRQRMAERRFPKQDQSRQALLFDGSHPALRVGVEIRRPWRQRDPRDPSRVDELLKSGAVFPVTVMDQVLPRRQEAP